MTENTADLLLWILPIFFISFWCAVCYGSAFIAGWRRLATHYAATTATSGRRFPFRNAKIGPIYYRGCVHFAVTPHGFFMWLLLPFRFGSPRLFIPWHNITTSMQKGWMFDYIVLTLAQEPDIKIRLIRPLASEIAAASAGALRIGAA